MQPWWWFWAPQIHFPLSGAVTQDFYGRIAANAGSGDIEREVATRASYGRQIGWLTELLLGQQPGGPVSAEQAAEARRQLVALHAEVDQIKARHRGWRRAAAEAALDALREHEPESLAALLQRYGAALPASSPSTSPSPSPSRRRRAPR